MKCGLKKVYPVISADFGKGSVLNYDYVRVFGRGMYQSYPQRYEEILKGMTETSGLGFYKALIVCSMEYTYMPLSM
jgi:hypothetical protein